MNWFKRMVVKWVREDWSAGSRQVDRATFPTAGQVYRDQLKLEIPGEVIDASLDQDARDNLY